MDEGIFNTVPITIVIVGFKTWFSWIRGNDKIIIGNLEKQGEVLVRATSELVALLSNYDKNDLTQKTSTIKELEHEGDKLTHELLR
jgi:uncharacterized protein Yka (UPF0111/DUF47 family)